MATKMYDKRITLSGYGFTGGAKRLIESTDDEVMLIGQYGIGKSLALAAKAHYLCESQDGIMCAMVGDNLMKIRQCVFPLYYDLIIKNKWETENGKLEKYGPSDCPRYINYPNGSTLRFLSLSCDDSWLASEFDFVAVFNAEEVSVDQWALMCSRTFRSELYGQVAGDVSIPPTRNDDFAKHIKIPDWILYRNSITILRQHPKDNPFVYDDKTHELTEYGQQLAKLYTGMSPSLTPSMAYFN